MNHSIPQPSALKVCRTCGQSKPLDQFPPSYKRNRNTVKAHCRACHNANRREQRTNDPYYLTGSREYQRAWRELNPELARAREIARYERNGEERRESARRARKKNSLREKAHYVVRLAVDRSALPPVWTMVCAYCDEAQAAAWHHHLGYEQEHWFDVMPTCDKCHGKEHRTD